MHQSRRPLLTPSLKRLSPNRNPSLVQIPSAVSAVALVLPPPESSQFEVLSLSSTHFVLNLVSSFNPNSLLLPVTRSITCGILRRSVRNTQDLKPARVRRYRRKVVYPSFNPLRLHPSASEDVSIATLLHQPALLVQNLLLLPRRDVLEPPQSFHRRSSELENVDLVDYHQRLLRPRLLARGSKMRLTRILAI